MSSDSAILVRGRVMHELRSRTKRRVAGELATPQVGTRSDVASAGVTGHLDAEAHLMQFGLDLDATLHGAPQLRDQLLGSGGQSTIMASPANLKTSPPFFRTIRP